ncbi:hypothetical protein BHM03_00023688 [Ensete ventricosum]|nr:hypothetical protein BHM03_00023688 [Ensete ventricosum]
MRKFIHVDRKISGSVPQLGLLGSTFRVPPSQGLPRDLTRRPRRDGDVRCLDPSSSYGNDDAKKKRIQICNPRRGPPGQHCAVLAGCKQLLLLHASSSLPMDTLNEGSSCSTPGLQTSLRLASTVHMLPGGGLALAATTILWLTIFDGRISSFFGERWVGDILNQ